MTESPKRSESFEYDVCLSFAGEDRKYVEEVANYLRAREVVVFYDKYEEVTLWGKDLYVHLDQVYRERARYCVLFASEHYARKLWTSHERQSAQARAFAENQEYILPARFDDTPVPGLRPTVGYIDLRERSPDEFARLVLEKLGDEGSAFTEYPYIELKVGMLWSALANVETEFELIRFRAKNIGEASFEDANGPTWQTLYELPSGRYLVYVDGIHRNDYRDASLCGAILETDSREPMTLAQLQSSFPALAAQSGLARIRGI